MKGYSDYPRRQRALIVIGLALIVAGVIGLLNEYLMVGWWHMLVDQVRNVLRAVIPIALIVFGAYLMWASRKGVLGSVVHPRQKIPMRRSRIDRRICGICGGFAKTRSIDSTYVRIAVLLLLVAFPGPVILLYLVASLLIPSE